MKSISYIKLQDKYSNKFIARHGTKIIATGKTLRQLFLRLSQKNIPYDNRIIIGHVPPKGAVCIYVYRVSPS